MFTKRQCKIFLEMCENKDNYFKANYFADKLNVSLRTVQNDIQAIKKETIFENRNFIIESKVPFGTRIIVKNNNGLQKFIHQLQNSNNEASLNYRDNRIHKLVTYLLKQRRSISLTKCADFIFVSKSTLLNDLKSLENLLEKFSLHLIQSKGYIWVDGLERDKRMCLVDIDCANLQNYPTGTTTDSGMMHFEYIRKLLMDTFMEERYSVSDLDFQNIIIWIDISVKRISEFFYLNEEDINSEEGIEKELFLAKIIYERLEKRYLIRVPQTEINFLALYIKNHSNFSNSDYISAELNDFILEDLEKIKKSYPTDFTHDMDLRISLALHCAPLISRARNNVQIKNKMTAYVKQNFPYAFDIATYFSYLLSDRFNCKIQESETTFLAIYFNKSLQEHSVLNGNKNICIITNLKRSEYFLLEQLFYDRFQKYISGIKCVSYEELEELDLDVFNLFFSTEENHATEIGLATKINFFPDDKELEKIQMRIEGFKNIEDIMKLFDSRLFFIGEHETKEDVQNTLVHQASNLYKIENLADEIELREEFGSTYFGNGIAVLHPMHSTEDDSFIGEYILRKPLQWDTNGNHVNLVFLVCIAKNNLEAFHAWDYMARLLFNNQFKQRIPSITSFEEFSQICENQLKANMLK